MMSPRLPAALRLAALLALLAPLSGARAAQTLVEQCVDVNLTGAVDAGDAARLLRVAAGLEPPDALPMCGPEPSVRTVVFTSALEPGSFTPALFCDQVGYRGGAPFELFFVTAFVQAFDGATQGTNLVLEGGSGLASPFVPTVGRSVDIPLTMAFEFSATSLASDGAKFVFDLAPVRVRVSGQRPVEELSGAIKFECDSGQTPPTPVAGKPDEIETPLACVFSVIDDALPGVPIQLCSFRALPGRFVVPGLAARADAVLNQ